MADHADAIEDGMIRGLPIVEEIVNDAVKAFLGWILGFHQIVIDFDAVDGADGGVSVGVSC